MKNNWFYIAVIIALVAATVVLWETPPQELIPLLDNEAEPELIPYAVIENAHSRHYDQEGALSYEFLAGVLNHYRLDMSTISEGDFTSMEAPQLTLFAEGNTWYITADKGKVTEFGAVLTLWENVRIWQPDLDNDNVELTTQKLEIRPRDKTVRTDQPVRISSGQGTLEAVGMTVNLNSETIHLLQRVRGYHEPI